MPHCDYCHEWCPEDRWIEESSEYFCWDCEVEDNKRNYEGYLKGPEWQSVRRRKLAEADFKCERCKKNYGLEVHHKTYDRLGKELMEDLEVLCYLCHRTEHGLL